VNGLFTANTSTITLNGSGNIANRHSSNRFSRLVQSNGIVTTLVDLVRAAGSAGQFVTGDETSQIKADGSNQEFDLQQDTSDLIINGVQWGGGVGTLTIRTRISNFPGDDYGDCDLQFNNRTGGIVMAGDVSTTGNIQIHWNGSTGTSQIDTNGFNLTGNNLTIGGSIESGGQITLSGNSILTVNGNLLISSDDGSTDNSLVVDPGAAAQINVVGNWTMESNTRFDAQSSTVSFIGSAGPRSSIIKGFIGT